MKNPTRRNRNIGTAKQGFRRQNKLTIPFSWHEMAYFFEKLNNPIKLKRYIHQREFIFVVEETRESAFHACTIDDLCRVLTALPAEDLGELDLIVLRQPKRKEEILDAAWGRLIYAYELNKAIHPAIILEAQDYSKPLKMARAMNPERQQEFERLKADGHIFQAGKREFVATLTLENVRKTQLYRTLLHEVGHYVHYRDSVGPFDEDMEEISIEDRIEQHHRLTERVKEDYAHRYAEETQRRLTDEKIIPFQRMASSEALINQGVRVTDFLPA